MSAAEIAPTRANIDALQARIVELQAALREARGEPPLKRRPTQADLRRLVSLVAEEWSLGEAALLSARRDQGVVIPRHALCWLAWRGLGMSRPQIASGLARDPSTILHAAREHDWRMANDHRLRDRTLAVAARAGITLSSQESTDG